MKKSNIGWHRFSQDMEKIFVTWGKKKVKWCGFDMWPKYSMIPKFSYKFPLWLVATFGYDQKIEKKKNKPCLCIINNYIFLYELV
jgi:hypothetical protein